MLTVTAEMLPFIAPDTELRYVSGAEESTLKGAPLSFEEAGLPELESFYVRDANGRRIYMHPAHDVIEIVGAIDLPSALVGNELARLRARVAELESKLEAVRSIIG